VRVRIRTLRTQLLCAACKCGCPSKNSARTTILLCAHTRGVCKCECPNTNSADRNILLCPHRAGLSLYEKVSARAMLICAGDLTTPRQAFVTTCEFATPRRQSRETGTQRLHRGGAEIRSPARDDLRRGSAPAPLPDPIPREGLVTQEQRKVRARDQRASRGMDKGVHSAPLLSGAVLGRTGFNLCDRSNPFSFIELGAARRRAAEAQAQDPRARTMP